MKKLFLFGALALLLASCGSTNELTHNLNNHTTQVVLSKKIETTFIIYSK